MTITREEIAAYADDELADARREVVEAAIAADPALAEQVEAHRALRERLFAHFSPVLEETVPPAMVAPLRQSRKVVSIGEGRPAARHGRNPRVPPWGIGAGLAAAAALALAVFVGQPGGSAPGYAAPELASALDDQLSGQVMGASGETRVLLSFRDEGGFVCRAYAQGGTGGIACRDDTGWKIRDEAGFRKGAQGEYRQAGSDTAALMALAQELAAGPAMNADEEAAARANGWR